MLSVFYDKRKGPCSGYDMLQPVQKRSEVSRFVVCVVSSLEDGAEALVDVAERFARAAGLAVLVHGGLAVSVCKS